MQGAGVASEEVVRLLNTWVVIFWGTPPHFFFVVFLLVSHKKRPIVDTPPL